MALDTTQPLSPGWWLARLSKQLLLRERRFRVLDGYYRGEPPLPNGVEIPQAIYRNFIKKARSNFAELIVEAPQERMKIQGFRTGAAADEQGDDAAWSIWNENDLDIEASELHTNMLKLAYGYAIVGLDETVDPPRPIITVEDPRQVITEHDPMRPQRVIAALKIFHDDVNNVDLAYLYLPGVVYIAARSRRATPQTANRVVGFTGASAWSWVDADLLALADPGDPEIPIEQWAGQPLPEGAENVVPVVPFVNKGETGEFEGHLDILDRINHTILQRMVIVVFQAFRQRAVKGDLPDVDPRTGEAIDYEKIFTADPGAIWQIPAAVDMWESAALDLTPVLAAIQADVEHLAAVTRTPMHYLTPGEGAQSAEGASLAREGLVFKTEDRITRASAGWKRVFYLAFLFLGDATRADLTTLQPMWAPAERYSLAEKAAASSQAVTVLPWETSLEQVWQLTPEEIARARTQRSDDQVLAQQVAMLTAASTAVAHPAPVEPPEPVEPVLEPPNAS